MTRLKFERTQRGLSQDALGRIVHVTQSEVGLIEQGRLIPTPTILGRFAAVFNVPADVLLKQVEIVEPEVAAR